MASRSVFFSSQLSRAGAGLSCVNLRARRFRQRSFRRRKADENVRDKLTSRCRHTPDAYKKPVGLDAGFCPGAVLSALPRLQRFGREVPIGAGCVAEEIGHPGDGFGLGRHAMLMESRKHEPDIPRHPGRHKGCNLLLESSQIIAAVADVPASGWLRADRNLRSCAPPRIYR